MHVWIYCSCRSVAPLPKTFIIHQVFEMLQSHGHSLWPESNRNTQVCNYFLSTLFSIHNFLYPLYIKVRDLLRDSCKMIWSWWSQRRKNMSTYGLQSTDLRFKHNWGSLYRIWRSFKSQILSWEGGYFQGCWAVIFGWMYLTSLARFPESGRGTWSWANVGWRVV